MIKWEYRHVAAGYGTWDALGAEGWELVGFDPNGRAHFKRPIDDGTVHVSLTTNQIQQSKQSS